MSVDKVADAADMKDEWGCLDLSLMLRRFDVEDVDDSACVQLEEATDHPLESLLGLHHHLEDV